MPIYEYECPEHGRIQQFFKTFKEAGLHEDEIDCPLCGEREFDDGTFYTTVAERVTSVPLPAHLYGDPAGYDKPSATKRHSYKTADKEVGNAYSGG